MKRAGSSLMNTPQKKKTDLMRELLTRFKEQAEDALSIGRRFAGGCSLAKTDRAVFWGVGGSAMSGEILKTLANIYGGKFVHVHRGTDWPKWLDEKTLVICSSYSGNSEELIKPLLSSAKLPANLMAVTSGGKLKAFADKNKIPVINIPSGMPPRCALGYLTFAALPALEKLQGWSVPEEDIKEMLSELGKGRPKETAGIVRTLRARSVHLYGSLGETEPVVLRWRAQLAENSKMLASHHLMTEMFHNEMEGWGHPKGIIAKSTAVFFIDPKSDARLLKKCQAAAKSIKDRGGCAIFVKSKGRSPLTKIMSLIVLGDWVSYGLALENGVEPIPIPVIERIKNI